MEPPDDVGTVEDRQRPEDQSDRNVGRGDERRDHDDHEEARPTDQREQREDPEDGAEYDGHEQVGGEGPHAAPEDPAGHHPVAAQPGDRDRQVDPARHHRGRADDDHAQDQLRQQRTDHRHRVHARRERRRQGGARHKARDRPGGHRGHRRHDGHGQRPQVGRRAPVPGGDGQSLTDVDPSGIRGERDRRHGRSWLFAGHQDRAYPQQGADGVRRRNPNRSAPSAHLLAWRSCWSPWPMRTR